jgi:hypothetical protein
MGSVFRVLLALAALVSVAEAAPFTGVIVDKASGKPVDGALVVGATTSATANPDGTFVIEVEGNETQVLVTAPGYGMLVVDIGQARIELEASTTEVIDVEGELPVIPTAKPYELTPHELRGLAGTGNDELRAAQALPGVARLPFSFGGIVMRGTSPRDNLVYLDGIEVPFAFHFGGITAFYPSTMLSGLTISNGGVDASYGRAQGGMVSLKTRESRGDKWRTGGSVGLLDASVLSEGPIRGGSILMGLRRSYFDIVAGPVAPDDIPLPSYWDAQVRMSFGDPATHGRITPLMFLSLDDIYTAQPGKETFEDESSLRAFFVRVAVPYLRQYKHVGVDVVPWLGTNQLQFSSRTSGVTERFERPIYVAGTRATITHDRGWRAGVDVQGGHLSRYQAGFGHRGDKIEVTNGMTTVNWGDAAIWSDMRVGIGKRFSAKPGLRLDYYGLSSEVVVDPRVALQERLSDEWMLRQTLGRYHQPPTPGDVDDDGGNPSLKSSYIDGATLGIERELPEGWTGSLTGFYNDGRNQGVRTTTSDSSFAGLGALGPAFELLLEKQLGLAFKRENIGRLRTGGGELLVKHSSKRWFGMLAYTLSSSARTDVRGDWKKFQLDQRHNLNLAGSVTLAAWRVGARVQVVSGTPEVAPLTGNLPLFFQLDVRVDRRFPQCWGDTVFYADIQNVTNRRNIEGRTFIEDTGEIQESRGLPIAPFIGLEFIPN